MGIIVAGWLTFDGCDCMRIIREGEAHILSSRQEAGCIAYDWAVDPLEPGKIHVFEEWESPQALGAHFRDPSYLAMRAHLDGFPMTGFDVRLYSIDGAEPVYTPAGQPRDTIFGVWIGDPASAPAQARP